MSVAGAQGSKVIRSAKLLHHSKTCLLTLAARGPQWVSDLEEAAGKAHVDPLALEQARADLGIVVSRGDAEGVQAVQWSLPG